MENSNTEFEGISKSLDSLEQNIKGLQDELAAGKTSQKAFEEQIKKLGDQQLEMAQALKDFKQSMDGVQDSVNGKVPQSLGQMIAASKGVQDFKQTRHANFEMDCKAATLSSAANSIERNTIQQPYQRPGIISQPEQPLQVENLFSHIPVSVTAIEYLKEGSYTSGVKITAEGQPLPETTFTAPTLHVANVVNIGHHTTLTQQVIDDAPALAAYIDAKMVYALNKEVDRQLINGDGSATQLGGLLKADNYTDATAAISGMLEADSTLFDVALALKSAMEQTWYTPQAFILNPADWTKLCMIKLSNGEYMMGGPQSNAAKNLWGVPVITCPVLAAGKFIMGNFTQAATIYDRQSLTIAMTDSDAETFKSMIVTLRVNRRLAFAVENPKAIYAGDFTNPKKA